MSPIAFVAIALAAVIGSISGSFFRVRMSALIWSSPLVALLIGGLIFVEPKLHDDMAMPQLVRDAVEQLTDRALLAEMLVAFAVGALASTVMVKSMRPQTRRAQRPNLKRNGIQRALARADEPSMRPRVQQPAQPGRQPENHFAALPVYEVAPEAPKAFPSTRPAEPATPVAAVDNRRRHTRRRSALAGRLLVGDGKSNACGIQNLSIGGARVKLNTPMVLPRLVCLIDLTNWLAHDAEVRWQNGEAAGLRFHASHDLKAPQNERERELHQLCADLVAR